MVIQRKLIVLAAGMILTAALFAAVQAVSAKEQPDAASDTVVAIVNGDKVYKKDVTEALENLPQLKGEDTSKVFPLVVNNIVNEKLLDAETVKAKIEDNPEYKKRLDLLKSQLVKQIFLEKLLKDKVTDAAVKSEYEKFKKQNAGKEEIHAKHIIVSTEAEAQQVIKDLDGGAKFDDLAKQRSSGPSAQNGGDLGWFVKEEMVPEFSNAAFQIKPGSYTKEPVKTQFGWHVIQVLDKRTRSVPDFKDVEMAIRNKLGQEALSNLVGDLRAKADIKMFDQNGKPIEAPKAN